MKLEEGEAKKIMLEEAFAKTKAWVNGSGCPVFDMASASQVASSDGVGSIHGAS